MFDTFSRVIDFQPERRKLQCHNCHQKAIHNLEAKCSGITSEFVGHQRSVDWGDDFLIFRCGNCDAVSFIASSWFSEDAGPDEFGHGYLPRTEIQYPPPTSSEFVFNTEFVPETLKSMLDEMLYCVAGGKLRLATIALRMSIEFIVKAAPCEGDGLYHRINDMKEKGFIDEEQRKLINKIRKMGNDSAHDAKPMKKSEIIAAMGVIELLLESFYNGPGRKSRLTSLAQSAFAEDDGQAVSF